MFDLLKLLGGLLVGLFRSRVARQAEIIFLRQQVLILKRSAPARLKLRNTDRLVFVWLYRLFPSLPEAAVNFKPETLLRWHRRGFRLYWRWKSRRRVGRPAVPADIRNLVRQINRENPLWGAPRIHGCAFRRKAAGYSDGSQPVIPTEASHPFRGKPATSEG